MHNWKSYSKKEWSYRYVLSILNFKWHNTYEYSSNLCIDISYCLFIEAIDMKESFDTHHLQTL